jgi:hypothetical protein
VILPSREGSPNIFKTNGIYVKCTQENALTKNRNKKLNELYVTYPQINPNANDALILELNTSLERILEGRFTSITRPQLVD